VDFIKKQYWERGYVEVISPNIFNLDLWHTSGHACVHPTPYTHHTHHSHQSHHITRITQQGVFDQ